MKKQIPENYPTHHLTKLTPKQLHYCLKHPFHCPCCKDEDIEAYEIKMDDLFEPDITQLMSCNICGQEWRRTYRIGHIEIP